MADEHLANWFGLNESKYEWAVREYYWQKRQEEEEEQSETPQSSRPPVQSAALHVCHSPCFLNARDYIPCLQAPTGSDCRSQENEQAAAESQALQGSAMV